MKKITPLDENLTSQTSSNNINQNIILNDQPHHEQARDIYGSAIISTNTSLKLDNSQEML